LTVALGGDLLELTFTKPAYSHAAYAQLYEALSRALVFVMQHEAKRSAGPRFSSDALEAGVVVAAAAAHDQAYLPIVRKPSDVMRPVPDQWKVERDGELVYVRPAFLPDALAAAKARYAQLNQESAFRGVVLDLRDHRGGMFASTRELLDWFLQELPMGGARQLDGKLELIVGKNAPDDITLPVLLLIDENTAGGCEWIAGVLHKRRRALLVGKRTRGAAPMGMPVDLPSGRMVVLMNAELITGPEDPPIHGAGVEPDVAADGPAFAACLGSLSTAADPQLAVAVAVLRERLRPGTHSSCQLAF
jgi:C-terminal processing protease CtpA/Prc